MSSTESALRFPPSAGVLAFGTVCALNLLLTTGCGDAPGAGATEEEAVEFRLEETLRLGALDGAEEELFGSVTAVLPIADGSVLILDRRVPILRRFAADGTFLENIGRGGEGPGEYRQPAGVAPLEDGGFVIWDPGTARLSFYGPDGGYRKSASVPSTLLTGRALSTDTLGRFYIRTFNAAGWRPSAGDESPPVAWIRVSSRGEVLDTVAAPPERPAGPYFVVQSPDGTLRPFDSRTLSALAFDGEVLHARNDRYVVLRGTPGGPVDTLVHRDPARVPLAGEERAQWEAFARHIEQSRETDPFPALPQVKPVLQDLWTDRSGRLWVRRHVEAIQIELSANRNPDGPPPLAYREPPFFDLYSPEGDLLGTLALPRRVAVMDAFDDEIWTVQQGEFGEPYVVRSRLVTGG